MTDKAPLEDAKIPEWAMEDARAIWKGMGFVSDRLNQVPALALALAALYASPQPEVVITEEMVERAAKAMSKEWGSKSNYFDVLARTALSAALKGDHHD